jgi:hypothetical protein
MCRDRKSDSIDVSNDLLLSTYFLFLMGSLKRYLKVKVLYQVWIP